MGLDRSLIGIPALADTEVSVAQAVLDRFAFWANDAVRATTNVRTLLNEGDIPAASAAAEEADSVTRDIYVALLSLGAAAPRDSLVPAVMPPGDEVSDVYRLLTLLEEAYTLASHLDAKTPALSGEVSKQVCALLGWLRQTIGASPASETEEGK